MYPLTHSFLQFFIPFISFESSPEAISYTLFSLVSGDVTSRFPTAALFFYFVVTLLQCGLLHQEPNLTSESPPMYVIWVTLINCMFFHLFNNEDTLPLIAV